MTSAVSAVLRRNPCTPSRIARIIRSRSPRAGEHEDPDARGGAPAAGGRGRRPASSRPRSTSRTTRSGGHRSASASASRGPAASPTTTRSGSAANSWRRPNRTIASPSTTSTRAIRRGRAAGAAGAQGAGRAGSREPPGGVGGVLVGDAGTVASVTLPRRCTRNRRVAARDQGGDDGGSGWGDGAWSAHDECGGRAARRSHAWRHLRREAARGQLGPDLPERSGRAGPRTARALRRRALRRRHRLGPALARLRLVAAQPRGARRPRPARPARRPPGRRPRRGPRRRTRSGPSSRCCAARS